MKAWRVKEILVKCEHFGCQQETEQSRSEPERSREGVSLWKNEDMKIYVDFPERL
jgi:hypothetical protein